ncbi:MAG: AAA family ATPase [Bacteroidetes bacterium]|nr:AAA family ATPase [Bacteroidota bacterium]
MKILKLRFKNINSLAGEHEIDFEDSVFTNNGLFAITGKTGAGKSSILDAISLALYGKTPRVEITGSKNPVITKGEKDCYAEVSFEVSGKLWKASWKQELTRTGNLKPVSRQIADDQNLIVADQVRNCEKKIEEIIGLTFEQFTKVIMLAQGSFAAFLQANKNDKGELLEQITGTEIYGQISEAVFNRHKDENEKLALINSELKGINILSAEEISQLEEDIRTHSTNKKEIDNRIEITIKALQWLDDINNLIEQIKEAGESLPAKKEKTELAKTNFDLAEEMLKNAKKALEDQREIFISVRAIDTKITEKQGVANAFATTILSLNDQINESTKKISEYRERLKANSHAINEKIQWAAEHQIYAELVTGYSAIENESNRLQNELNDINNLIKDIENLTENHNNLILAADKAQTTLLEKNTSLNESIQELEKKQHQLRDLLGDKNIIQLQEDKSSIDQYVSDIKNLAELENSIIQGQYDIKQLNEKICEYDNKINTTNDNINQASDKLKHIEDKIRLLEQTIELAKRIQSLEEHRLHLKDGEACPLCGSKEHPFATDDPPPFGEKENQLNELIDEKQKTSDFLIQQRLSQVAIQKDKESAQVNISRIQQGLIESMSNHADMCMIFSRLDSSFQPDAGYDHSEWIDAVLIQKEEDINILNDKIQNATQLTDKITDIRDNKIPALRITQETATNNINIAERDRDLSGRDLSNKITSLSGLKEDYHRDNQLFSNTLQNFGVNDIVGLKDCLDLWNENESIKDKLEKMIANLSTDITVCENSLQMLTGSLEKEQSKKEQLDEEIFQLSQQRHDIFGNKSVDEVEANLINTIKIAESKRNEADDAYTILNLDLEKTKGVIQEKEDQIRELKGQSLTEKSKEELENDLSNYQKTSSELSEKIGAGNETLRINADNTRTSQSKLKEKDSQQLIVERWANLNQLIGSKDGQKFRVFAQALTFEQLIILANRMLQKMSDRYLLKRTGDISNPFELSVIDRYQNHDERTAENLSGGEKFIVSLSLALALANMASSNMRIDTMFVDEGFGTLDADYLDVALSALSSLQSEGKIIGVISHIAELKERITTHIEVQSVGNGRSTIQIKY